MMGLGKRTSKKAVEAVDDPKRQSLRERSETGCVFEDEYPEGSSYLAWLHGDDEEKEGSPA